ncbi:MAG: FecR domain-containing protein [Bacteroidota bacterium]
MKVTRELLEKYSRGECTADETAEIETWLSSVEDDSNLSEQEFGDSINNIRLKLHETLSDPKLKNKVIPLYKRVTRYAAAAVFLCVIGFSAYYFSPGGSKQTLNGVQVVSADQTVETRRGEKRTLRLPDGSTIRLNYESELKVSELFNDSKRIVYLTGDAHFDVISDPEKPFIIYTQNAKTEVLGTSFTIMAKEDFSKTEVIVTSGKVAFSEKENTRNTATLTINNRAILTSNKEIETDTVDAQKLVAWKDNRLLFEDQSLGEIIEVVEPWYDVEFTIQQKSLLKEHLTFSYQDPSLDLLMDRMSKMLDFEYRIEGKEITIY